MQLLLTLCLMACLVTIAWTNSQSWGKLLPYDCLVYREEVIRKPVYDEYQYINIKFPKPGQTNNVDISYVEVKDNFRNTSGARPYLQYGGPTFRDAFVRFITSRGRGMNSTLSIYVRAVS